MDKAAAGQLGLLRTALKDYAEPMTEEVWEKLYRANVAVRLAEATKDGAPRYTSTASRDVMVNMIKVATMGLTLGAQDGVFLPTERASTNLKKYADEVRPKLQKAIDPATGQPRLRSIVMASRPPKKLPEGTYYWLIGLEQKDDSPVLGGGRLGANTVIGGGRDLGQLKNAAKRMSEKFKSFYYCTAKIEALSEVDEMSEELPIQNTAVFSHTISA